jgi:hypothetical protein
MAKQVCCVVVQPAAIEKTARHIAGLLEDQPVRWVGIDLLR